MSSFRTTSILRPGLSVALAACIFAGCMAANPSRDPSAGQQAQAIAREVVAGSYKEFIPVDPMPADVVTYYDDAGSRQTRPWNQIPAADRTKLLPNQSALTSVEKIDASAEAKYLTAGIAGEIGSYRVTLDFVKFLVNQIPDPTGVKSLLGYYRTGVGIRIKANVITTRASVDLGSLMALAFAAKAGSARGDLSVELIGIDSEEISYLFPMPSQVDETSIQKVLEAVAAIKSKLNDSNTRLTPQIVAIKLVAGETDFNQARSSVPALDEPSRLTPQQQHKPQYQQNPPKIQQPVPH